MAFSLAEFSTPPTNYIGAFMFISYIVAALELTNFIISHLFPLYESRTSKLPTAQRPDPVLIIFFSSLAALSFAVLSYHMLSFLVESYTTWCYSRELDPTLDIGTLMPKLGAWMIDSMLFTTFAQDLVGRGKSKAWLWTGMALATMMAWGQWMGRHGRRRDVPNLWAYFVLGQILPPSFALNLFFITLLCLPNAASEKAESSTTSSPARTARTSMLTDLALGGLFVVLLYSLPSARDSAWFMHRVLVARMLLFAPFLSRSMDGGGGGRSHLDPFWVLMGGVVVGLWSMVVKFVLQDGESALEIVLAARSSPAVRALVDDTLIGIVSAGLWTGLGLYRDY